MSDKPRSETHAPIVWANALMFALTFAAAAILVPWYGLTHGFTVADYSVFAFLLVANGMAITATLPPRPVLTYSRPPLASSATPMGRASLRSSSSRATGAPLGSETRYTEASASPDT